MLPGETTIFDDLTSVVLSPLHKARWMARRAGLWSDVAVPSGATFPAPAMEKWLEQTGRANVYLEYGAGGSTVEAAKTVRHVVSVESDSGFLQKLTNHINSPQIFHPVFADIGMTRAWGRPAITLKTAGRMEAWKRYPEAPWRVLKDLPAPDVILIDGRFRVACVLESMLRLPEESDAVFLFDDFIGREHLYSAALLFAREITIHDRMIAFRRSSDFDRHICKRLLGAYRRDFN